MGLFVLFADGISSAPARFIVTHNCQVREDHDLSAVTGGIEECPGNPALVGHAHATKESGTGISSATKEDDTIAYLQVQDEITAAAVNPVPIDRLATGVSVPSRNGLAFELDSVVGVASDLGERLNSS